MQIHCKECQMIRFIMPARINSRIYIFKIAICLYREQVKVFPVASYLKYTVFKLDSILCVSGAFFVSS